MGSGSRQNQIEELILRHFFLALYLAGLALLLSSSGCKNAALAESLPADFKFNGTIDQIAVSPNSGPGLIVCEPISKTNSTKVADFGSGTSAWLDFVVGGQPQCGRTPTFHSLDVLRLELDRTDLRMSEKEISKLPKSFGITHVATGLIEGTPKNCRLTYRIYKLPEIKLLATHTISGSLDGLARQLPSVAAWMTKSIGVKQRFVPNKTYDSANNLSFIGNVRWRLNKASAAENKHLIRIASTSPLAGILCIECEQKQNPKDVRVIVDRLVKTYPNNALMLAQVSQMEVERIPLYLLSRCSKQLEANVKRFPNNCLLQSAQAEYKFKNFKSDEQLAAANQCVSNSPNSSRSWLRLSWTLGCLADNIRRAHLSEKITPDEQEKLHVMDLRSLGAAEQSTKLDPLNARAWYEVSRHASVAGFPDEADQALQMLMKLKHDDDTDIFSNYSWGLELYGPHRLNDRKKRVEIAKRAGNDMRLSQSQRQKLISETEDSEVGSLINRTSNE